MRSRRSRSRTASTRPSSSRAPAGTRSTSPRRSRPAARRCPTPCATPCSPAPRGSAAEGDERADLLDRRSYECYLTAAIGQAIEAREQALAAHRASGNRLREGDGHRWLSRFWWYAGNRANAEWEAMEAVELLATLPPG